MQLNSELSTHLVPAKDRPGEPFREKGPVSGAFSYSGGGIRTRDLRVMSPRLHMDSRDTVECELDAGGNVEGTKHSENSPLLTFVDLG
jgi:hypothetical protein